MKYIKLYEEIDIDFDDIVDEEFNDDEIQVGDVFHGELQNLKYIVDNGFILNKYLYSGMVINVISSNEIDRNKNKNGNILNKPIPKNLTLFAIEEHWPWFIYDNDLEIKIKRNGEYITLNKKI